MKKFLSLVLALVMTMSLVTISAGAKDFTDDSKLHYEEAVDVISALDIVDGYSDGSFRPDGTLTRGAAAKIICNMILGPTTADALSATSAPFSDVPADSVFAGYIAYCAKEGIISGYADGTFRPAGTLNGYQFMKMLLGALGYDSDIEGFTGPNWSINVAKLAIGIDLDDDLEGAFNGSKAVTREEACLYALNTLKATMVEYDSKTTVTVNGAEVVVGGSEAKDMKNPAEKSKQYIEKDEYMQFAEKYFTDLKLYDGETDDFERPANQWKIKNDEIGTYAQSPDATYTVEVKGKMVYADLGDDYEINGYYVNGDVANDQLKKSGKDDFAIEKKNDDIKLGGNGALTEVYIIDGDDDNDDTVRIITIETYLAEVSGDYDEDDEELELVDLDEDGVPSLNDACDDDVDYTLSSDDFANLDTFEDEDYVLVTIAKGEIKSIAKAEQVTAEVTAYVDEDSVTAGGTEYEYSKTYNGGDGFSGDYSLNDDYDLYLDAYGYVIFADGVEDDGKYVYVDDFFAASNSSKATVKANAYFLDGTNEEISIDKVGGKSYKGYDDAATLDGRYTTGSWFTYTTTSDGKYKLSAVDGGEGEKILSTAYITNEDNVKVKTDTESYTGTKDTVFIVVDEDDDVSVYTGINKVPEIKYVGGTGDDTYVAVVTEDDTSYAKYVFIDRGDQATSKGGDKSGDVIFLYKSAYDKRGTDSDENVYYSYKAVLNGEVTKVKFDEDHGELGYALLTEVEYDEDGYVSDYTAVYAAPKSKTATSLVASYGDSEYKMNEDDIEDWTWQVPSGDKVNNISQKNGIVTIDGEDYCLADGAKIMVVDDGDMKTVSAKKLVSDYSTDDCGAILVCGVADSSDEFTYLFVVTQIS